MILNFFIKRKIVFVMLALTAILIAPAESDAGVGAFLTKIGTLYRSNLGIGTVYNMDDGGGYATMGSISLRSPGAVNPLAGLFNVTMPTFHAGCNGLDLNTGGLFFITDPNILVQRLTSYGTSVVYGMLIGLASSLPVIGHALKWLRQHQVSLDGVVANGCELGKSYGKEMGDSITHWYDTTQQDKATKAGQPADKAVHTTKTAPVATSFNIAAITMGGYSYQTLETVMSMTGTLVSKPGAQQGAVNDTPYPPTFSVKDFMTDKLKNKLQLTCSGAYQYGVVPTWDGSKPTKKAPCLTIVKTVVPSQVKIQKKFSDLIMVALYHLRYSKGNVLNAQLSSGGMSAGAMMHGYTVNELNTAIMGSGAAFAGILQIIAARFDVMKAADFITVRNRYADPFAPYMAISYLRGLVNKLLAATIGAPTQYTVEFPLSAISAYRKTIQAVATAANAYKVNINSDYKTTKLFVEEADRLRKLVRHDSALYMQTGGN